MKTSNKLLLGLIIAIFLIVTIFIGIAKYYQVSPEAYQGKRNVAAEETVLSQKEAILRSVIFSPVIFLQLPR